MSARGVKSVMYAGEGEPLLHKDIAGIINHTKKVGIDVAITTNGVLLHENLVDSTLAQISWIKISINGATEQTYAKIHRTNPQDFKRVMRNLAYALRLKKAKGIKCVLGLQLLLLPENAHEVILLAKKAKDMGMDYLVVKPYSQHPFSKTTRYKNIRYQKYLHLLDKLRPVNSDKFNVIFRFHAMQKWDEKKRSYKHCLALPFWSYIDAGGNVWGCSAYIGDRRFFFGNINKNTFKEICEGRRRKGTLKLVEAKLDAKDCRVNCRMDEINRYLWELKHPPEHVNFI
jgi:radical SAM protein with 4Fe4S-binding SPASM domain